MGSTGEVERGWVVRGQVQGVGFRWATQKRARAMELDGWVRNEPDGTVRVLARGARSALDEFEGWLHQGPRGAVVSDVERIGREVTGGLGTVESGIFEIRH